MFVASPEEPDPRPSATASCRLQFGSLDLRLAGSGRYVAILPVHFRIGPHPDDATTPDVELAIVESSEPRASVSEIDDPLEMRVGAGVRHLTTVITELDVDDRTRPVQARLVVHAHAQEPAYVDHYVAMNIRALLRIRGRLQLHGAAVVIGRRVSVFLGDKGAGKSTISLALGRAGATVLADDQLMLHVDDGQVRISGVDGGLRVTAQTERHFFTTPLEPEPQDYGGMLKKEVPLGDHVSAQPGVDYAPDVLYFPRVGARFEIAPIARSVALERILAAVVPLHRFAGPTDQRGFLRVVTAFVNSVEVFDLSLSSDLDDLGLLVSALGGPHR